MYSVSNAFHQAVADGNPQIAMLIFSDAVFTNEDIDVNAGIQFHDYFNMEEDIAIGQALSNEIEFTLVNEDRLLNSYKFGDFLATIGVLVDEETYQQVDGVKMVTNNATWIGTDKYPYVKRNGNAVSAQPSFAVTAMLGYSNKVYAFSSAGACVVYDDKTGNNITSTEPKINDFMKNKAKGWAGRAFHYWKSKRELAIFDKGTKYTYEFAPLGYFIAERPKAPDVITIDMSCNDLMTKFDDDMPTMSKLGVTFPITFGSLLKKICDHVDVPCKTTTFINSTAKLTATLKEFDSATMRDVIKWIAEAAAGNARINRDGELIIDWVHSSGIEMDEGDYETFDPYWYRTKTITKLENRGSDGSYSKTRGDGKETYLIQDNPLLKGVS